MPFESSMASWTTFCHTVTYHELWPLLAGSDTIQPRARAAGQNAQAVSRGLFAGYLLPVEILSVILLVALVGAVVLAKTERV